MGIPVPSSTPITIAAEEINEEFYQTFTIADNTGQLIQYTNPLPTDVAISGYASISSTYQGTVVPIGGVYINDLTGGDFTEMVDGEMGTVRVNNRRALMAASDGQVTILTSALSNNYHDVVVASGTFTGTVVPAYSSFFTYSSSTQQRHVYIPMSRSGFRRATIYVKHSLVNDSDATAAAIPITMYADFGQFETDFQLYLGTISGLVGQSVGKAFTCYNTTISGSGYEYIPALDSPLAGVFVTISPSQVVSGDFEIYASKGA
jgi:hypothetical protein